MRKRLLTMCLTAIMMVVGMSAYALDKVNGAYQIGTAADLEEFAALVNDGEFAANAVLTADIDRGIDGTMIGTSANPYQGTFDGKGHAIIINMFPEDDNAGLFRYTGFGAIIQNLKVTGTISTAKKFAGGLVARNSGIIRSCYVDVTIISSVPGDATHGGIAAVGLGGCTIESCLAKIAIMGETTTNCGGVVGWAEKRTNVVNCLVISDGCTFKFSDTSNGHSNNLARNEGCLKVIDVETYNADPYAYRYTQGQMGACYNNYVTNQWGDNVATTVVAYEDLADGRICYQLNNDQSRIAWVQRIGTDPFPVPAPFGSGQVYASASTGCNGKAEGELTFSNSGSDQATKHQFDKYGVCTACGCFNFHMFDFEDPAKFDQADRSVLLRTAEDIDFVEGWNRIATGFRLNMKMENDIEYIAERGKYIFNNSDWIDGNFNGQGHEFTIGISDVDGYAALFPEMTGNIENLILHGTIQTTGGRTGSVCGEARMALVRNVFSDVDIKSDKVGDNTSGGLFGWMGDKEKRVENCIYAGTFTLPGAEGGSRCARVGGFSGWAATKTIFSNCAILGKIIGAGNQTLDDDTENSQNISRNPSNVVTENVYVLNPIEGNDVSDHDKYIHYQNEQGIVNGELAFLLNGRQNGLERFYQKIGEDSKPLPIKKEGALIYTSAGQFNCDGTPIGDGFSYTNNPSGEAVIPPHQYVDGWCVNCGKFDENFLTPVDGWFEVSNGAEFTWWTNYAFSHQDACIRLTEDIDMGDYMERFVPVEMFVGEFDGQGHTFSNFVLETDKNYQGLIGTIGAKANIHDFILDESCSITGGAFCGIIGGTNGSGKIYVTNVGNEGKVTTKNQNAAGIVGVDTSGSMDMFITNCWVTGEINGGQQSGAICGYSSGGSIVKDCWSTAKIPQLAIWRSDSFTRGNAQVINCYEADLEGVEANKQQHNNPMAENRRTYLTTLEEVASGALCFNLNKKQFRNPSWYQTIGEDEHPYPYSNHDVIVFAGEQYLAVSEETLSVVASTISSYYADKLAEVTVAYTGTLEDMQAKIDALDNLTSVIELADALDSIYVAEAVVDASVKVYKKYQDKCKEVKTYLDENPDLTGPVRVELEDYLKNDYGVIMDEHNLPDSLIEKEIIRVDEWLAFAIKNDYKVGNEVTNLFVNADFRNGFKEGWESSMNKWGNGSSTVTINEKTAYGSEAWNTKFDMHQTVKNLKPGYYLVGVQGAFRPSNNRYGYNYAAQVYANDNVNYLQTVIEDYVKKENAVNGENVYISEIGDGDTTYDWAIYSDGYSTDDKNGADTIGYVVHGPSGMAVAGYAGRYQNYIIAKAAGDSLTIGICNPGTNYGNDWTGFSSFKIIYAGGEDDAEIYVDEALESMIARANTILTIYRKVDPDVEAASPSYPAALKDALEAAVAAADAAQGTEAKMKAVETLSQLFKDFYEARQAYIALFNASKNLEAIEVGNLALIEKDAETGEWTETGDFLFDEKEIDEIGNNYYAFFDAYYDGTYSTQEALNAAALNIPDLKDVVPVKDEDGYLQISTPKQFAAYRSIAHNVDKTVNAKLMNDVDMNGIAMLPIGKGGDNAAHIYCGTFDGQGHALTNVYINDESLDVPASLFYELQNATAKNFKLTGEFHTSHKFSGPLTRWMSGKSTIDNCEIEATMYLAPNLSGDTSSGGLIGRNGSANSLVNNCLVNTHVIGEGDTPHKYFGGVAGWADASLIIKNTLILSQYENVGVDGDNSRTISRGTKCTPTNVFVSQFFREAEGTLVTEEQLASGEICWKLNGEKGEGSHWFQTLGKDAAPHLFVGDYVWKYGDDYQNIRPNLQLNAFASKLSASTNADQIVIGYTLNAEAKSGAINFYVGDELKYSHVLKSGDLFAGGHEVGVDNSLLGVPTGTKVTYALDITSMGVKTVTKIGESYKVWGPYGMVINNDPASKGFGQTLLVESYPQEIKDIYISHDKPGALYAFDVNFKPINSVDGTPGFYGGLQIKGETPLAIAGTYQFDLRDIRFTADGRLFVARASGVDPCSVYEINPEDLNEPWKPVFKGGTLDEATGITYVGDVEQNRMAIGLAFEGKGADLKMYVLGGQRSDGKNNTSDYNCSVYNLGTATEWTGAPSANFNALDGVYTYSSADVGIHEDGQGGLWFIQNRNTEENPALKHFNAAEGKEDYSNQTATSSGKMAMTSDGKYLAIPQGSGKIVLYETDYVPMPNGKISLTPVSVINVSETRITALAFDYANNLYVASASTETFSRYAIPSWNDNKCVTPAVEGFTVGVDGGDPVGIGNVNANVNNGSIYNIAGQRVNKAQKGVYIVDGKKNLVK